ncbi:ABC transporter ATP-binding protein [Schnuerera sp. xch1]|uniref:ABC transporter ATP-binding protein n=1 Tax=Schnuerera sp. xch1 TaxID=2874283 RepID=UPI001CBB860E|nr:ABC transporter ATP-binding protein [Schnuerera sp. xch1]MBZ2174537.1 ABC transporter ATP-binding protein [Schnuerera sp. xch1]
MAILRVDNLHFSYGKKKILKGINFSIDKSMLIGIIGANGSGKTTLLKNISGYLKSTSGNVFIAGKNIKDFTIKEKSRYIGYVPQDIIYDFQFNCFDVIMMGRIPFLKRFQMERKEDKDIVKKCMKITNTWQFKKTSIKKLSGGERQRVYIARALAQNPKILLMDEPVSHLDIKYQIEILSLVKDLSLNGILVITVLHDINIASQFCDEIFIMKEGKIIDSGYPKNVITPNNIKSAFSIDVELFENPTTHIPYVIASLNEKNNPAYRSYESNKIL